MSSRFKNKTAKVLALISLTGIITASLLLPIQSFALFKLLPESPGEAATGGAIAVGAAAAGGAEFGGGAAAGGAAAATPAAAPAAGGTAAAAGSGAVGAAGAAAGLVVPVFDGANLAAQVAATAAAQTADIFTEVTRWGLEDFFKQMLALLKKKILDMMVDQIVMWVQGGGEPKFVSDWGGLLKDAANEATGNFINAVGLTQLCEPLGGGLAGNLKIAVQASLIPVKKFSERARCTLKDIVANIEDFANDFQAGGWLAYSESWNPQNNYFGLVIMASAELEDQQSKASGAIWSEAIAGAGFLSTKKCVRAKTDEGDPTITAEEMEETREAIDSKKEVPARLCAEYEITTPGKTVGDAVAKAVGADIDFLVNAEDLSEYIAAIADALINRIIKEGVGGLLGAATKSAPRGGVISSGSENNPCAHLNGEARSACEQYGQSNEQNSEFLSSDFQGNLQTDILSTIEFSNDPDGFLKNELIKTIAMLENYILSANQIYNSINGLNVAFCNGTPKQTILQNIQASIKFEQNNITILKQYAPNDSWSLAFATEFKMSLDNEQSQIASRTAENLSTFNQQLNDCRK